MTPEVPPQSLKVGSRVTFESILGHLGVGLPESPLSHFNSFGASVYLGARPLHKHRSSCSSPSMQALDHQSRATPLRLLLLARPRGGAILPHLGGSPKHQSGLFYLIKTCTSVKGTPWSTAWASSRSHHNSQRCISPPEKRRRLDSCCCYVHTRKNISGLRSVRRFITKG